MKKSPFGLVLEMAAKGVGLAIGSLMQADRKKVFSVLGLLFNGLLKTALGWFVFFGGSALLLLIDYVVGSRGGTLPTGRPPEGFVFGIHAVCAAIAIVLAYMGTVQIRHVWLRCLVVMVQIPVAAVLWVVMQLYYGITICGVG